MKKQLFDNNLVILGLRTISWTTNPVMMFRL